MVMFAILVPVLALVIALVVNLGGWFSSDAGVQKAADFGALAGAQYLAAVATNNTAAIPAPCSGSPDYSSCAKTVAQQSFEGESLTFCDDQTGATKDPWQPAANQVKVGVCHNGFGGIFASANIRRSAIAKYGGINGGIGAIPVTFQPPPGPWPAPGTAMSFVFDNNNPISGGFNLVDLGGSYPCNGNGASALATCIECAQTYSLPNFTPNPPAAGCSTNSNQTCSGQSFANNPGFDVNSNPIGNALQSLYGRVVLIPIYDPTKSSGNGRNGTYYIMGFAAFEITNWDKKTSTLTGTFWGFLLPNQTSCTSTGGNFGVYSVNLVG
jgi:hypothetical protein